MMAAARIIRWSTAGAVVGVAAVAAVASYEHAYDLVRAHGEVGWTARLVPLTVDGLIYASSMVMLNSARRAPARIGFSVVMMHRQCRLPVRKACGRRRSPRVPGRRPG
jgi:Protein of unknown function (DUF2637)